MPHHANFEEIEHTADWALRIRGEDLSQLFLHAAQGMNSLLVDDPSSILLTREQYVAAEAHDAESLLVTWLSELAYLAEMEGMVFTQFRLQDVTPTRLEGTIYGGHVSTLEKHIKAVTYHNLEIIETADGLEVTVIFDV